MTVSSGTVLDFWSLLLTGGAEELPQGEPCVTDCFPQQRAPTVRRTWKGTSALGHRGGVCAFLLKDSAVPSVLASCGHLVVGVLGADSWGDRSCTVPAGGGVKCVQGSWLVPCRAVER